MLHLTLISIAKFSSARIILLLSKYGGRTKFVHFALYGFFLWESPVIFLEMILVIFS